MLLNIHFKWYFRRVILIHIAAGQTPHTIVAIELPYNWQLVVTNRNLKLSYDHRETSKFSKLPFTLSI